VTEPMRYSWAVESHVGLVRSANEDSYAPRTDGIDDGPVLIAVADGMGGHAAGDVASRVAIEAATSNADDYAIDPVTRVEKANKAVIDAVTADPALAGMGTTLTLGSFGADGTLRLAHVGDSRAYLRRNGVLQQLTSDDTVVAELVEAGHLSEEQARNHPRRHLVTQSIGMPDVGIETVEFALTKGDIVLLCSDGLTGMISDDLISELLARGEGPSDAAWALITAANAAGGHDNTTVAVVEVDPDAT